MASLPPQPPGMNYGPGSVKPHRGAMILVFGILGFLLCFIFGIVAWVMGNRDMQEMRAGVMDRSGEGLTNAGRILGIIAAILNLIGIGLAILTMCGMAAATAAGAASLSTAAP